MEGTTACSSGLGSQEALRDRAATEVGTFVQYIAYIAIQGNPAYGGLVND